jgi:hypothetical protein
MSNEIDVVVAAGERALDVAGIEGIEKSHNVLTVNILDHIGSAGVNPTRIVDCIVNGIARRSIGKTIEPSSVAKSSRSAAQGCTPCHEPIATGNAAAASRPECAIKPKRQLFLLFGLCPAGVLPDENGEGGAPPFLRFLSAFGFFFSLLLRI